MLLLSVLLDSKVDFFKEVGRGSSMFCTAVWKFWFGGDRTDWWKGSEMVEGGDAMELGVFTLVMWVPLFEAEVECGDAAAVEVAAELALEWDIEDESLACPSSLELLVTLSLLFLLA